MATLMDLKQQRKAACDKAESLVSFAESARRPLSATENTHYQEAMAEYNNVSAQIAAIESKNTITRMIGPNGNFSPMRHPTARK